MAGMNAVRVTHVSLGGHLLPATRVCESGSLDEVDHEEEEEDGSCWLQRSEEVTACKTAWKRWKEAANMLPTETL